ncbi:DUF3857 domain-containing protein [Tenacibaculum agarivorans]|uniref:DUF3857 domain-containing protein n=1 Tax=Tenacibaculum agarivorans TaxID=1908389 RepID=UPI00094BB1B2|nr:DUF3857 domain-containing protein [Tenacibaculum agarivorans]
MKKIIFLFAILLGLTSTSQEIKFGKISKDVLQEKFYPIDSTATASYLLKHRKTYYEYNSATGFQIVNEVHYRIKIYAKEGFDMANFSLVYYDPKTGDRDKITGIKGYTFNLDENGEVIKTKLSSNSIFKEKLNKYRSTKKITMPDIKEGSVVDLKYKHISPYTHYIEELSFQNTIPIKKYYAKIEIPEWYVFKKMSKGYYAPSLRSTSRNRTLSIPNRGTYVNQDLKYNVDVYEGNNIPALKNDEPYVSNVSNYFGGVKYELSLTQFPFSRIKTHSNTWKSVCNTIFKSSSFGGELSKTKYFKDDLKTVIADATTLQEKVVRIFEFVKKKVKWNEYNSVYTDKGVKTAYKEGVGNVAEINLILTAMLRESGLNANPVLVSTRKHGIALFPSISGFNYIISMVEFPNGQSMLLDATEPYSLPNVLPIRDLNLKGRKITKEGISEWVNLNSPKHTLEENTVKVKIDDDMMMSGFARKKETNLNALLHRKNYNHIKKEDRITKVEEKYNIEIEDFKSTNQDEIYKPYISLYKFSTEDLIEEINGKLYVNPLLFLTNTTNPFKSKERKFPIDFATPWQENNNVYIQIPEGYQVESIPEQLAIGLPDQLGFFKFIVSADQKNIRVNSKLQMNSAIIAPVYYEAVQTFYKQIIDKETEKIVLTKKI